MSQAGKKRDESGWGGSTKFLALVATNEAGRKALLNPDGCSAAEWMVWNNIV